MGNLYLYNVVRGLVVPLYGGHLDLVALRVVLVELVALQPPKESRLARSAVSPEQRVTRCTISVIHLRINE